SGGRIHAVSALTMSGESEYGARYVTYPQILNVLTRLSASRMPVGPALFRRIVFNVAVSNSDDHARNHAALWDGEHLRLSPAYDLCPGPRSGQTAEQAMAFGRSGIRTSTFHAAISVAAEYGLSTSDARSVVDDVVSAITDHYADAADQARLSEADRTAMLGRQFLNPGVWHGLPTTFALPASTAASPSPDQGSGEGD
ncbi:MAG TPA: HipA domain-containing protein, partial [Dermatophilaceae bacterium]|nr:HipA domain-containing protein [Dermatophilaceae bacterium]